METTIGSEVWLGFVVGGLPLLGLLLWWWNELWYVVPLKLRCWRATDSGAKLPPGHMGFPYFGELLTFLWYFKIRRRPDEFINSKRRNLLFILQHVISTRYGDVEGLYRTHLFGSPSIIACFPSVNKFVLQSNDGFILEWSIIACFPSVNKFVLQSNDSFILEWSNVDLVGRNSLVAVHGNAHARLRSYVVNAINSPNALRHIAASVQPLIVAAMRSWAQKGRINAYDELRQLTLEHIGKSFANIEPGPLLDNIGKLYVGLVRGFRAMPLNLPGTAAYRALQCRKRLEEIFRVELEKKNNGFNINNDLMDGLIEMKDEDGNKLSDQEVVDNIVSLVIGGLESTSLASMWAIYCLAKFPNVLRRLREENMSITKQKQGDFITIEDVSKLKYTKMVAKEIIRMANISAFISRLVIKETEYKGYKIPKNWKVILWLRYLHTDPDNFDDPMCFNPDRWNEPARPGTYQVFGGGFRICAGNMLARTQIALLLHHLSIGYRWELVNPDAGMVYLPHQKPADGVEVSFSTI